MFQPVCDKATKRESGGGKSKFMPLKSTVGYLDVVTEREKKRVVLLSEL